MKKPEYFPVLDSMRFIACMCVFLAHSTAFFAPGGGIPAFWPVLTNAGYYGVIFFYTLSGFLITWLLVREKARKGTIAVGAFYIRRALRIWPLYYLMTAVSFFVLIHFLPATYGQHMSYGAALLLFVLLLPNIACGFGFYMPTCFHLYTIGCEEQFYLLWPLVIRRFASRPAPVFLLAFFVPLLLSVLHQHIAVHGLLRGGGWSGVARGALTVVDLANIPAFAAGGAGAYVYLHMGDRSSKVAGWRLWSVVLPLALIGLMIWGKPWATGYVNLLAIIFVWFILHLIIKAPVLGSAGSVLATGGRISYGIYVYHPAILLFVSWWMSRWPVIFRSPYANYLLYVIVSLLLVLVIAGVSYYRFERLFLRSKDETGIARKMRRGTIVK